MALMKGESKRLVERHLFSIRYVDLNFFCVRMSALEQARKPRLVHLHQTAVSANFVSNSVRKSMFVKPSLLKYAIDI